MTALHVIDHLDLGGAQTVVRGIASNRNGRYSHSIFSLRSTTREKSTRLRTAQIRCSRYRSPYNPLSFAELWLLAKRERPDVIHAHLQKSHLFCLLYKLLSRSRAQVVLHIHGRIEDHPAFQGILRVLIRQIAALVCVSADIRRQLNEATGSNICKSHILHNFVDVSRLQDRPSQAEARWRLKLRDGKFVFGFLGRLSPIKGWQRFVELAEQFLENRPEDPVGFVIAGSGPDLKRLHGVSRDLRNLHVLGRIDDVSPFFSAIDCLVIPSMSEAMGLVQLEAQYCQVPVIAHDIPGLNETLHDGKDALLVSPDPSNSALFQAARRVFSDQNLRRSLISGGRRNWSRYSIDSYIVALEQLYDDVVERAS